MELQVDWQCIKPWLLPVAGSLAAACALYKLVKIARADSDMSLLCKKLKPSYFSEKVVWVTGASSGSELVNKTEQRFP